MDACLELGGLQPGDLSAVVFYENPYAKLERVLVALLRTFPRSWRQFPRALGSQLGGKVWIIDQLADVLELPRSRIEYSSHHRTHAASAFYTSPFERAAPRSPHRRSRTPPRRYHKRRYSRDSFEDYYDRRESRRDYRGR